MKSDRELYHIENIGFRIHEARSRGEMTQAKLAEEVNLSTNYIGAIERGEKFPRLEVLVRMANKLQVTSDYLLKDAIDQNQYTASNEIMELLQKVSPRYRIIILETIKALVREYEKDNIKTAD